MSGCKRGLTPINCVRFQKMNDLTQKVAIPITLGHALAVWIITKHLPNKPNGIYQTHFSGFVDT